ncbi:MAG: vacuolar transporter chaperone [Chrysothrix sp. TS-e1954]|nr:MAG: vacuolar transporter chaperone [Chrysothrix sp. TS-e1954]
MRFGHQLHTSLIRDYSSAYISYDDIKASLKTPHIRSPNKDDPRPPRRPWNEEDESRFIRQLEQELDKVFTFQHVKSDDVAKRVASTEKDVYDVINRSQKAMDEAQRRFVQVPNEDDYMLLEEVLSDVIADVHDLAKFTQLNYTGFQKIIKKHDKMTSWHLKPVFATRLSAKPFWKSNYDALIVKLSRLYDLVRTRGNPIKGDSAAGGGQQNFVRQTTKYWVHPDNITELKLIILKHLPVLVFNPSKEFEAKDCAISSIYYDNAKTWELYTGRLKKTEGAEAIRLRWYGGMDIDTIFVERKTHREDWTGEKSVKARFSLKEKNVNDFLVGKLSAPKVFEKARREGKKSPKDIADLEQLAKEIQYRVITRDLVPVTRSFYNRTAFQLPGDARVRISLDTELTMTREDNEDGRIRAGKNWRRTDIGIDFPFSQLSPEDVERFPYAVLEVKLQTQAGQEPPQWIRDLCSSHLVESVPKFSKFIHGTATLNPNKIKLLPFWLPQMDTDIRKPPAPGYGIERPAVSTDASTSANLDDDASEDDEDLSPIKQEGRSSRPKTAIDSETDNEDMRRLRAARDAMEQHEASRRRDLDNGGPDVMDIEERIAAAAPLDEEDYPYYDSDDEDSNDTASLEEARRIGGWTYFSKRTRHAFSSTFSTLGSIFFAIAPIPRNTPVPAPLPAMGIPKGSTQRRRFIAPPGKRIHVPVRIEPKVYFAAERTFLAWLESSIIIGSIAAALLNFGDDAAVLSAGVFTILAAAALAYSLCLYLWRAGKIRGRRAVTYHDRYGPTALCLGMAGAVGLSFGFRFAEGGQFEWRG